MRKAQVEEFYKITWESPKEQIFEMFIGEVGQNMLSIGKNRSPIEVKFIRKIGLLICKNKSPTKVDDRDDNGEDLTGYPDTPTHLYPFDWRPKWG